MTGKPVHVAFKPCAVGMKLHDAADEPCSPFMDIGMVLSTAACMKVCDLHRHCCLSVLETLLAILLAISGTLLQFLSTRKPLHEDLVAEAESHSPVALSRGRTIEPVCTGGLPDA